MKIKISNHHISNLKDLKEDIEELLSMNFENMEVTEDNIKKVKEISRKINSIGKSEFHFGSLYIKIVSSDGTELTTI